MNREMWTDKLAWELQSMDPETVYCPQLDVPEGGHVVGDLMAHEDLRKLWTLYQNRRESYDRYLVDVNHARSIEQREEALREAFRAVREAAAFESIFWVLLCELFPELLAKQTIGVRKGWKVFWEEPPQMQFPPWLMR